MDMVEIVRFRIYFRIESEVLAEVLDITGNRKKG